MSLAVIVFAVTASTQPAPRPELDFDLPAREAQTSLDSPHVRDMLTAAMALPYAYGVTRMPCRAWQLQPERGWSAAREPSGKIAWSIGPATRVTWRGIYGTCLIESPVPRELLGEGERSALECECNGWIPKGISDYPLP